MKPFDSFAAIDWSGARGVRHKGIAVAVASPGDSPPRLIEPPDRRGWPRAHVMEWMEAQPGRLLVGFDFSFAPPFIERGAYLPGMDAPDNGPDFWRWLDRQCDDPDLGAVSFMEGAGRAHFWMGAADGRKADFLHVRRCEAAFNAGGGGKASTLFDCVGAAQVAKASFAGMRLLARLPDCFAVWPFQQPRDDQSVVVELYSRAMLRLAGGRGLKLRSRETLDVALRAMGSQPMDADREYSDHETDALLCAAALRAIAGDPKWWNPIGLDQRIARTEGWTFGIA